MIEWNLDLLNFSYFQSFHESLFLTYKSVTYLETTKHPAYEYECNTKPNTSKDYFQASTAYTEINDEMVRHVHFQLEYKSYWF